MKILSLWMVALMALSFSFTFVPCSDDNDDTGDTEQAKATAGTYKGYSISESRIFSDCLMGDDTSTAITTNAGDTVNLVYKSGSGGFILNNLTTSSKSFKGEGGVALAMEGNEPASYEYTLGGSVSDAKVLTLKASVPVSMGDIDINFIQTETPIACYVAATHRYSTSLAIGVMGSSYGSTEDCEAVIRRASETTADITLNGFGNLTGGGNMNLGDFTISGVNVEKADSGRTFNLGAFESATESASGTTPITGESLEGTITANGKTDITVTFRPGATPVAITTVFTENVKKTSA